MQNQGNDHQERRAAGAFAEFLRAQGPDFEAFCATRPDLADGLRSLMSRTVDATTGATGARASTPTDPGRSSRRSTSVSPGDRIGSYRILEVLGEGGMGIVYLAEQKEPVRRRVALKVIKLGMDTREVIARFEAERQALAMLNHPAIARIHEAGATAEGRLWFAMEHVPGLPITEYCDRHKLSVRDRLRLFLQVCQGVQHAHHRGLIHRDIKPSNILVSTPDERPVAKIIDFGVAKATHQRLTEKTIYTELGRAVGTPTYMSPEQAESSSEDVDHRTDVYSLGVLLYELLVGELPLDWDALSKAAFDEIMRCIREEDPVTPSTRWSRLNQERTTRLASQRGTEASVLRDELRGDLDWIVMKAMEKERERRYTTVAQLAEDITRYLENEPVMARPPGMMYRLRKYARKHRTPVVATAAVVLSLLAGVIVSSFFAVQASIHLGLANERAAENLALADLQRLRTYTAEAGELWPDSVERRAAAEQWLRHAEDLLARRSEHREELERLRARATRPGGAGPEGGNAGEGPGLEFADAGAERRHELIKALVAGLERFGDPDPGRGTVAAVRRRLAMYPSEETIAAAWQEALASIRDVAICPAYNGLETRRLEGLFPVGRDPDSRLWEFVHLRTGGVPRRDERGRLVITEETGLVLVLLPGGRGLLGSPGDEEHRENDETLHEVSLSPFLIGKFETRQAVWERVTGSNLSGFRGSDRPVEAVTWNECMDFCDRLGLHLPSEAQWEYACRAGSSGAYAGTGRLAEMGWYRDNSGGTTRPVGQRRANAFGLHDLHGNVWEWCLDVYDPEFYLKEEARGPDPVCTSGSGYRVLRGGSWDDVAKLCRSANRLRVLPSPRYNFFGFRPVRRIQ